MNEFMNEIDQTDHIGGIVIAVPARDEFDRIERCVSSLLRAIDALGMWTEPRSIAVVAVVASDGSTDGTNELLERLAALEPGVIAIRGNWNAAGGARRAAVDHGLAILAAHGIASDAVWIATTDADTAVPADWLMRHVHMAESGHDALAGIVELSDDHDRTAEVLASFSASYPLGESDHEHVHGANLGIRASAYLDAGGFPAIVVAEDHGLWNELRRRRFRIASPVDLRVFTSSRLRGRAPGGFADTIAEQLAMHSTAIAGS